MTWAHDQVVLWFALKTLKGPGYKFHKGVFMKHTVKVRQQFTIKVSYYLVHKNALPVIPKQEIGKLVDPRTIPDFPESQSPEDVKVFKNSINKDVPPDEFAKFCSSCVNVRELVLTDPGSTSSADGTLRIPPPKSPTTAPA